MALTRSVPPLDGDVRKAIEAVRRVQVYPLSKAGEAASYYWIDVSNRKVSLPLLDWEGTLEFWRRLHAIVDIETAPPEYRIVRGMLAELGIEKGKPFNPDLRTISLLEEAAATAHAEMSVSAYANRRSDRIVWEGNQWEWIPLGPFHASSGDFGTAERSAILMPAIITFS